ncbi:Hvo_1808 family surface protein [Haloarchaeobius amylolyticus]|uniref:Hvo_1808 family surface protein n=1 Tax=Haloarchaeobius amylolyticus TaxID=1198296 RepID=UPI0022703F17|nr:Hvo_1808 family surface protein [Haloarchaeobius amylolyticus]
MKGAPAVLLALLVLLSGTVVFVSFEDAPVSAVPDDDYPPVVDDPSPTPDVTPPAGDGTDGETPDVEPPEPTAPDVPAPDSDGPTSPDADGGSDAGDPAVDPSPGDGGDGDPAVDPTPGDTPDTDGPSDGSDAPSNGGGPDAPSNDGGSDAGQQDGDAGGDPDVTPGDDDGTTDGGVPVDDGGEPHPVGSEDDGIIGYEAGYWYNQTVVIDQSDGVSDAELDALVAVTMARVEYIRGLEYLEPVDVKIISRADYRAQLAEGTNETLDHSLWNNQVWEALFIVGEDANVSDEFTKLFGSNVLGYYAPKTDEMVIVSTDADQPTVDPNVLVHEMVHALQDQHFDLTASLKDVQDEQLARNGIVEGEANYITALYKQHCGTTWTCTPSPSNTGADTSGESPATGLLIAIFQPYSDGPVWMEYMVERKGWEAVTTSFENMPTTTETFIHPEKDDAPTIVRVDDATTGGWARFESGQDGADVLGEASIYAMFYHLAKEENSRVISAYDINRVESEFDTYNYVSTPSEGWAGDRIVPYQKDGEYGYVWVTEWDSTRDAQEFYEAYTDVLEEFRADRVGPDTWVVDRGPFADAFHVTLDGTRVTIVNAPTVEQLSEIRMDIDVTLYQRWR